MTTWDDHDDTDARPVGDVLDGLGIRATLNEGELVAGALVLLKVVEADGSTRLSLARSEGLGWIERAGMLRVAETLETSSALGPAGDD
ncbi:hypothetical protein [Streptomyces sp. NPDC087525]|uniref:hypothetical protein n=1 Tax=Streptomyces sp. NPDC087525 TaxID=3365793 RepID=UPI0038092B8F